MKENKNFKIEFAELTTNSSSCNSTILKYSTVWGVDSQEPEKSGRRLIVTEDNKGYANYFYVIRLLRDENIIMYGLRWCPVEICPNCRFSCGDIGVLVENGTRLLALDHGNSVLPVVFERA